MAAHSQSARVSIAPGLGLLLLASLTLTTGWRFTQSEAVALGILRDQPVDARALAPAHYSLSSRCRRTPVLWAGISAS